MSHDSIKQDKSERAGPAHPEDSAEFEIRMIEKAIGPLLPVLLERMRLPPLKSREDLDKLAAMLAPALMV